MTRARRRFYFCVHTRSHLRMFADAVRRLEGEGFDCRYVDVDDILHLQLGKAAIAAASLSSIPMAAATTEIEAGDILVVGVDWAPEGFTGLIDSFRQRGIVVVGCVDGCRFAKADHYRHVDHLLGWGPSCLEYFPQTGIIVGSPEIEAAWQARPQFAEPPFAAVNYKFVYERTGGREKWVDIVRKACETAGIAARFSRHPADRKDTLNLPSEELSDLLRDCSLLITRPSTAVYQAQAAGKPVIFLPMQDEELVEFADPMGAFDRPTSSGELVQMIRRALEQRDSYRERCRAFFERHVSIDPQRPVAERIATALRDIHAA